MYGVCQSDKALRRIKKVFTYIFFDFLSVFNSYFFHILYIALVSPVHITKPSVNTDGWGGSKTRTEVNEDFALFLCIYRVLVVSFELDLHITY